MKTHTVASSLTAVPYVSHVPGETSPRLERGPDQSYSGPAVRVDLAGYGGAFWLGYEGGTMAEDPDAYAAHLITCANAAPLRCGLDTLPDTLRRAEQQITQLCGMVNTYSKQLGLGQKVRAEDWIELAGIAKARAAIATATRQS